MKRILFAVAFVAVCAGADRSFGQGPAQMQYGMAAPTAGPAGSGAYGVNPALSKLMWWKKDKGCSTCGGGCATCGHGGCGAGGPTGTLVFPQHQFARSPRDWFMTGY
jgi:hypothetical protein